MYFTDQNLQNLGIFPVYFNTNSLIVDNFVRIGFLYTKILGILCRFPKLMLVGLIWSCLVCIYTRKRVCQSFKPKQPNAQKFQAKYQKHFKIHIFYSFIIWVIWSFVIRMCFIDTFTFMYVPTVATLTNISTHENKDISRRCKTFYTSTKPIQEPAKKWISVTCITYKDLFLVSFWL